MPEGLPAAGAKRKRRLLILPPLLGHQRDQFACNERKGDEDRRKHDSRHRKDDFYVIGPEPGVKNAAAAEKQHIDEARDHRRHRDRQVDKGDEKAQIGRAEEHKSELQSLMRISYAVFCLKKKTKLVI